MSLSQDFEDMLADYHSKAQVWAAGVLANKEDYVILDTETTGLQNAEFVQVSIIDLDGGVLLNTLAKPTCPIEPGAQNVHGISMEQLVAAPTYVDLYPQLEKTVNGRTILAYNAAFDRGILENTARNHGAPLLKPEGWECVMLKYAEYYGEWNEYYESFRWQKLKGGDHSALGDCRATLDILKQMAGG